MSPPPPLLSVILCTHNPHRGRLERTLEGLRNQTLNTSHWELLLVDNASSSPVAAVIDCAWHPHAQVVPEPTLGLTPARLRGIATATGDLLVFVDDDNILAADYLEVALRIANTHPWLGAFGGSAIGEFERSPAPELAPYLGYLALRHVKQVRWTNSPDYNVGPIGAGLCLRHTVADHYAAVCRSSPARRQLDRRAGELTSGGDSDMAFTACDLGLGIGSFPELSLRHLIPAGRVELDYLVRLLEAVSACGIVVASLHGVPPSSRTASRLHRIADWWYLHRLPLNIQRLETALRTGRTRGRALAAALTQAAPSP